MPQSPQQPVVIHQTPGTSGLAIAGLIFSILGWFTLGLLCIPGAFLCFLALFSRGPKGTAIAGLIVGFPGTLFFMLIGLGMIMGLLGLGSAANSAISEAEKARKESQSLGQQQEVDVQQTTETATSESVAKTSPESPDHINSLADVDNPPVEGFDDYGVSIERSGELTVCQVTFNSLPPTSDIASEVVRNAMRKLVTNDSDREILAMAFNASGDALSEMQYGGALSYKPSDKQILTMDQRSGLQATEGDEGTYFVRVEDSRTAKGITPVKKWYNTSIVFPNEPSAKGVKAAVLKEIGKLKTRGLDVNAYIYTGDKFNKITWKQIKAPNGKYMAVDFVAATGEISPNWDWGSIHAAVDEPKYESRTWTDATGRFSVDAVFVSYANGKVTIKKDDNGKIKTIPLDRLSETDRLYVQSLQK